MEFKTLDEMKKMTDGEVIKYSSLLMSRKIELANSALEGSNDRLIEANEISKQLKMLAEARDISSINQ